MQILENRVRMSIEISDGDSNLHDSIAIYPSLGETEEMISYLHAICEASLLGRHDLLQTLIGNVRPILSKYRLNCRSNQLEVLSNIEPRIVEASIGAGEGGGMFPLPPTVFAVFSDGMSKNLFSFYNDELSFKAEEFIGLTEDQAKALKFKKDKAYLQS